jgi:hypothetical protein
MGEWMYRSTFWEAYNRKWGNDIQWNPKKYNIDLLDTCVHTGFLPVLFLNLEDGGNKFLRNVD